MEEYLAAIEDAQEREWEFWEQLDGETPLGGEMRLSSNLIKDNTPKGDARLIKVKAVANNNSYGYC